MDRKSSTPSLLDLLALRSDPSSSLSLGALLPPGASALIPGYGVRSLRTQPVRRKVYFAFRYKDIMRVNNVRQSGKIGMDEERNPRDFYDRSIWEKSAAIDPESLKRVMREGMEHSSVVCVLSGSDTFGSRWVKYEVARAVIDNRGLLNVDINGLNHHLTQRPDPPSLNPLWVMGVHHHPNGQYYLCEECLEPVTTSYWPQYEWRWQPFQDYSSPVSLPAYLSDPGVGYIRRLSDGTRSYDYIRDVGSRNLGGWLDFAATQIGR